MSIFENMHVFSNTNLGPTIQQFQILNIELQNLTNNSEKLETSTKSLDSRGMVSLSGTLGDVQRLFESLGVALDSVPNLILSVTTTWSQIFRCVVRVSLTLINMFYSCEGER